MSATTHIQPDSIPTMSSPRLPAELTDQIIHHLQRERQALFALSLVCRAWVPAARCHLFRTVRLERIGFGFGALTPCAVNTEEPLTRSMGFIQLLEAENCTMRTAVQELSIDQRGSSRRGSMGRPGPRSSSESSWMDSVLATTATLLPNVLRLRLEGVDYPALSSASKALLIEGFQSVMELDFFGMRFGGEAEVAELVASFPATKSVDWSVGLNTKFAKLGVDKDENAQAELQLPASLSRCNINAERACSSVGKALVSRASELTLTSEEKYFSVTQAPALNELFASSGDQLKHLVYNVWHWTATPGSFIDIFDRESSSSDCSLTSQSPSPRVDLSLSKNTSLESLLFQQFRFTHPVLSISSLLSSIPSTTLSTIVFEVDFSSPEYDYDYECSDPEALAEDVVHPLHLCDYDWEAVDEAIKGAAYAEGVKAVGVVVHCAGAARGMIDKELREKMRWCEERGVLMTRFCD